MQKKLIYLITGLILIAFWLYSAGRNDVSNIRERANTVRDQLESAQEEQRDQAEALNRAEEANWVESILEGYGFTNWHLKAGIWYDYENTDELRDKINSGEVDGQIMTNCISRFVNVLWSNGRERVGVYGGYDLLWKETYLWSQCGEIPVWVAQYYTSCDYPGATMWQYTDRGDVAGVTVDRNKLLEEF